MATRAIVTSHPVVACDVCGRSLLRGETPDVFLAGGQRRTVCELCVPRAAAEGWLREADNHAASVRPTRARRAGSLLGRLRQLREPDQGPSRRERHGGAGEQEAYGGSAFPERRLHEFLDGELDGGDARESEIYIGSVQASESSEGGWSAEEDFAALDGENSPQAPAYARDIEPGEQPVAATAAAFGSGGWTAGEMKVARALEVFNAGEQPRRVAGVSRSLGAPAVTVRPLENSGGTVAIVIAWELCWYRYEVDLGDEAAGLQLVAQGMELEELPEQDRRANAAANERGELAALGA
ncbi:MAG TPA: hypothetical protein VNU24_05910 [Solirubrobacteraceae bacterium]|jgi:hypothetical protein|nr:hypothetical protein [Solirubrobacteraceae bacterium]